MDNKIKNFNLQYGVLALPIAMVALPIYIYVPKLYGHELGMPIEIVGLILLCLRIFDAAQDPFIGFLSDRQGRRVTRKRIIFIGSPFLVIGFLAVFNPLTTSSSGHAIWLSISLFIVYFGLSIVYINYLAIGTEVGQSSHEHTEIAGYRAFFGVAGVILALIIPEALAKQFNTQGQGLSVFSIVFLPFFLISLLIFSRSNCPTSVSTSETRRVFSQLVKPFSNTRFKNLLVVFIFSGLANGIPGLLILFFVEDILQLKELSWLFVLVYFLSSGLAIPLWTRIAKRIGKKTTWQIGMGLAIFSFFWAFFLDSHQAIIFALICVISGIANGSDLTIPFSMLSDQIKQNSSKLIPQTNAGYFGVWQFVEKTNLGIAAGLSLPLLGLLNYQPGDLNSNRDALQFMYAIVPCGLKFSAMVCLMALKIEKKK